VKIKSVHLKNFRNHADTYVELGEGLNVFVGQNAQGKTNLLESIYIACIGRGFKSAKDRDVIRIGQTRAVTKIVCATDSTVKTQIEVLVSTQPGKSGKQITINNIPIAKMGQLIGTKTCIFFCPDELKLVKESPQDRRRFMDIDISQIDKTYFYNLLRYNKILKQRNALLKTINPNTDDMRGLDIWDEQLAEAGAYIIDRRILFCEELKTTASRIHKELSNGENLALEYEPAHTPTKAGGTNAPQTTGNASPAASARKDNPMGRERLLEAIHSARSADLRLRTTTVGPHRDDIKFTTDGLDARTFASQGQQRTIALAVKLAELDLFTRITGSTPILLLDDVFSELDNARQSRLLSLTQGTQTIITTNAFGHKPTAGTRIFTVAGGKIIVPRGTFL